MLDTQHSELQKLLGPHQVADTLSAFVFLTFIHIIWLQQCQAVSSLTCILYNVPFISRSNSFT